MRLNYWTVEIKQWLDLENANVVKHSPTIRNSQSIRKYALQCRWHLGRSERGLTGNEGSRKVFHLIRALASKGIVVKPTDISGELEAETSYRKFEITPSLRLRKQTCDVHKEKFFNAYIMHAHFVSSENCAYCGVFAECIFVPLQDSAPFS